MKEFLARLVCAIGMDKIAHFFGCGFVCLALGRFANCLIAAGISLILGLAKELIDFEFNWKDILADLLGVVFGFIILII